MTSSKPGAPRQVPPPPNSKAGTTYSRFIPREELQDFATWTPGAFGERRASPSAARSAPAEPTAADVKAAEHAARQAGYQDGYRDGLAALESFKQSFSRQMAGQIVPLLQSFDAQLFELEQRIAASVAEVATQLARQVVRSELATRPELVTAVAQEAVNAVLLSAKQIVVQVHPADHALIAETASEALAARGARLVPQADIERGGCVVETDAGHIDARIESRWNDTVRALGCHVPWRDPEPGGTSPSAPADDA